MTAFNVVRFRVKPGMEDEFVESHRKLQPEFEGFLGGSLIQTGEQTFCLIGEWQSFPSIVAARPQMIALLDAYRDMLEDLGGELGITDPVSGVAVARLAAPKARKKAARKSPRKTVKKAAGKGAKKTAKKAGKTAKKATKKAGKTAKKATKKAGRTAKKASPAKRKPATARKAARRR
jgi:hypothetical protein